MVMVQVKVNNLDSKINDIADLHSIMGGYVILVAQLKGAFVAINDYNESNRKSDK